MGIVSSRCDATLKIEEPHEMEKTAPNFVVDQSETNMCVICLDELCGGEPDKSLRCGHQFHTQCIKSWLARSPSCPCCRRYDDSHLPSGYNIIYPSIFTLDLEPHISELTHSPTPTLPSNHMTDLLDSILLSPNDGAIRGALRDAMDRAFGDPISVGHSGKEISATFTHTHSKSDVDAHHDGA